MRLSEAELSAKGLGESVLVDGDIHRLTGYKGRGNVPDALVLATLAPGVLDHVEFLTILILSNTVDQHAVVIGQLEGVEALLAILGGHLDLLDTRLGDALHHHAVTLVVRGTYPALLVGACILRQVQVGKDAETIAGKSGLAHVRTPGDGEAVVDRIVNRLHQLIEGDVVASAVTPVVGDRDDIGLVERLAHIGGERYVVIRIDLHGLAETLRGIGLTIYCKGLGCHAEIGVDDTVVGLRPDGRERPTAIHILQQTIKEALGDGVELLVVVALGAVVESLHLRHRDDAVVLHGVDDVVEASALGKVLVALVAHIVTCLILIGHRGGVHRCGDQLRTALTDRLSLEEGVSAEGPAGTGGCLILYRGDLACLYGREDILIRLVSGRLCCSRKGEGACGCKTHQ